MVILENKRLPICPFGCESLARTAAFHTKEVVTQAGKEHANDADLEKQKFISRICAISQRLKHGFTSAFTKNGATLIFTNDYAEIRCQNFKLKFTESEDLAFFIEMVRPYIKEIYFVETHFWRVHLIQVAEALIGNNENGYIRKTGNDNAYGTLIEYLGPHVKRIEVDDEFVAQLRDEEFEFDYCKVKSQHKAEMYYTKSYFDVKSKEYDLLNVCTLKNMVMYEIHDFDLVPRPYIEKIRMNLTEDDDQDSVSQGAQYLKFLAPNLKCVTFVQNKGLVFSDPEKASQVNQHIMQFIAEKYENLLSKYFPSVKIELCVELSLYAKNEALNNKIDWFSVLSTGLLDLKRVMTEFNTQAYQAVISVPGHKDGNSVTIRVHAHDNDYTEDKKSHFPHAIPAQVV